MSYGSYGAIDYPQAVRTKGNGINDFGVVVGSYFDAAGNEHGYAATLQGD